MPKAATGSNGKGHNQAGPLYAKLEERIMARDSKGASDVYYDLVRAKRPFKEIMGEAVRIHAPYTHVPYHQRIDDGYPNFVNNDHCLLSARAALNLHKMVPGEAKMLPLAQTIWYIPTGLDIWNQKLNKAPGHYTRGSDVQPKNPPKPAIYWADQKPLHEKGPVHERLNTWLQLVERGEVINAYRVFLGLMEEKSHRKEVLAELAFAGLIDVQDRVLFNRSYTTGHKSFRARATIEIGAALGWDTPESHNAIYAGALDIAVGPRWYSTYESACVIVKSLIDGERIGASAFSGTSEIERGYLKNTTPPTEAEAAELIDALINQAEPAHIYVLVKLIKAGRGPRQLVDVIQRAAAQVLVRTNDSNNFSIPQHCYEYCNTLGWFYDTFDHPRRLKLLFLAAAYVNRDAWHQRDTKDLAKLSIKAPRAAAKKSNDQILKHIEAAMLAFKGPEGVDWARAYLDADGDKAALRQCIALTAARIGNDPHNQELGQLTMEDYAKNDGPGRDMVAFAGIQHTACHRKYGDVLEASRRFGYAVGVESLVH
ncbi:MAG: hypothetical protein EXR05_00255 [Acetobacteraceae bacterium]|nr:hypothetical protein [Acetobacteraceae bacterium]MSP29908.1 hypothetical protein [Acetobacteraceae bacterium]